MRSIEEFYTELAFERLDLEADRGLREAYGIAGAGK